LFILAVAPEKERTMASFNRVILLGNLTRDPELRYISTGTPVCEIGLAVNDRRKGPNGDWIEETTFVDVTLWSRTAEVVSEYCTKGSPLFIEGRLKLDSWEKDGKKNYKLRVVGERIQLLGSRGQGGQAGQGGGANRQRPQQSGPSYDEADYGAPPDEGSYGSVGGGNVSGGSQGGADIPF
jgi:single-strand DNA-binding protein